MQLGLRWNARQDIRTPFCGCRGAHCLGSTRGAVCIGRPPPLFCTPHITETAGMQVVVFGIWTFCHAAMHRTPIPVMDDSELCCRRRAGDVCSSADLALPAFARAPGCRGRSFVKRCSLGAVGADPSTLNPKPCRAARLLQVTASRRGRSPRRRRWRRESCAAPRRWATPEWPRVLHILWRSRARGRSTPLAATTLESSVRLEKLGKKVGGVGVGSDRQADWHTAGQTDTCGSCCGCWLGGAGERAR
jgi:hypothetical protein